jgi:hypothetical protein
MISRIISSPFILIIILSLVLPQQGKSQNQLTKLKEWSAGEIVNVSVDRMGNFFLLPKKGGIKKYDIDGKVMASLPKRKPTLLETWYHPSIFLYDRTSQKYFTYGRFFEDVKEYKLAPEIAIEPYLVCPTHDNRLWIFDKADYSLKKVNPLNQEVINEFNLDIGFSTPEFTYLREYQNLIFLQEKNSNIWIINTLGKIITKIEINKPCNFGFFGQELYYQENNIIHFFDLLTEAKQELPLPGDLKFAIVTDERIMTVSVKNKITLYNYIP